MINNRKRQYVQKISRKRAGTEIEKKYAVIGLIFSIILLISIFTFIFRENNDVKRVFFFPEVTFVTEVEEKIYSSEERIMPFIGDTEKDIELFVNEIILGPIRPDHGEIIPKNTQLLTTIVRDDVLYLNFSGNALLNSENTVLDIGERINTIGSNIKHNFTGIKNIYICVNGQIPDLAAYYNDNTYNFTNGKNYKLDNIN